MTCGPVEVGLKMVVMSVVECPGGGGDCTGGGVWQDRSVPRLMDSCDESPTRSFLVWCFQNEFIDVFF